MFCIFVMIAKHTWRNKLAGIGSLDLNNDLDRATITPEYVAYVTEDYR